ncbi:hypothetical protein HanRHA438_Chr17g0821821 [Helianthus annuus]|nr:hypothetical protein HanRHA438_Chr17g0821821 [Helianthus annuus]
MRILAYFVTKLLLGIKTLCLDTKPVLNLVKHVLACLARHFLDLCLYRVVR